MKNWRQFIPHALGAVALLCLTMFGYQTWRARAFERERDAAIQASDSVRIENRATKAWAEASDARAQVYQAQAESAKAWGRASDRRVAALVGDNAQLRRSLANLPTATPSESLGVYKQLVANLDTQVVELTASRDSARSEATKQQQAAAEFHAGKDSVTAALARLEVVHATAVAVLARSSGPCSLLFFRCPSRKTSAVAGLIVGAVAGVAYSKRGA